MFVSDAICQRHHVCANVDLGLYEQYVPTEERVCIRCAPIIEITVMDESRARSIVAIPAPRSSFMICAEPDRVVSNVALGTRPSLG